MTPFVIVTPSFRGAWRLGRLLESVADYDPAIFEYGVPWLVVEDPSDRESTNQYTKLLSRYPMLEFTKLNQWSNMHGAAQKAFELAIAKYEPEWIMYLGDDILVTCNAISSAKYFVNRNSFNHIGLIQLPYWNAHDLSEAGYGAGVHEYRPSAPLFKAKEDMYLSDASWLERVPRNPHWDGDGFARPYVNVNGAGFVCSGPLFAGVGGFAEGTWCLDESLSVRVWTRSERSIVCLPGPPFVHYFGGATESEPPGHSLHTAEAWTSAMGMTKEEASVMCYAKMAEREKAALEEAHNARYF